MAKDMAVFTSLREDEGGCLVGFAVRMYVKKRLTMKHRKAIALFAVTLCVASPAAGGSGVGTWWHWMNGHITREGITKDLEAMAAAGIDTATIFNAYRPFGSQFLMKQTAKENVREIDESVMPTVKFASPEWLELFRFALDEAERLGMTIGAANCDGWSESGGPWIAPEQSMKTLVWEEAGAGDGASAAQAPRSREWLGEIAVVTASSGKAYRFGWTTNGKTNHPASPEGKGLECDKMDAAALDWHFKHYPKWLIDAAGRHAGKTFKYFLVDSWECGFQTWTENFAAEFQARRGYDPVPWLPVFAGEIVGTKEDSEAFLHDFNLTCSDLIIDNYFKRLSELCHENGMELYCEGIYGWDNLPAVDVLKTYKYCDVPMTEFWAKVAAHSYPYKMSYIEPIKHFSPQHAAVLYNKPVVACEAYTGYGIYSDGPFDLKPYGDRAFAHGVSKMILHSYVHQPTDAAPGLTLGIYGQAFNRLNPWYNFSRPFWEYHERIQDALQGGSLVADSLVYIGDKLPAFEMKEDEVARLLPLGRSYQYINQDVLLSGRVSVEGGMICLDGDKFYTELIVRDDALDLATIEKLEELHRAGAAIAGVKPVRTLRLMNREAETARLREISDRIWGESAFLHAPSDANDIEFGSDGDVATMFTRHVRKGAKDVYFLASAFDFSSRRLRVKFNARATENPVAVVLDPIDGRRYALAPSLNAAGGYELRLRPRQSVLVIFGEDAAGLPSYADEVLYPEIRRVTTFDAVEGTLTFESEPDIPTRPIGRFHSLTEDDDPDVKYYCGVLRYDFSLDVPCPPDSRLAIEIPQFGCTAEVTCNGKYIGTIWDPGQRLPLEVFAGRSPVPGESEESALFCADKAASPSQAANGRRQTLNFSIRVTNPWRNRLVGDLNQQRGDKAAFTTSPGIDKYEMKPYVSKNAPLIPAGISAPIRIWEKRRPAACIEGESDGTSLPPVKPQFAKHEDHRFVS